MDMCKTGNNGKCDDRKTVREVSWQSVIMALKGVSTHMEVGRRGRTWLPTSVGKALDANDDDVNRLLVTGCWIEPHVSYLVITLRPLWD